MHFPLVLRSRERDREERKKEWMNERNGETEKRKTMKNNENERQKEEEERKTRGLLGYDDV